MMNYPKKEDTEIRLSDWLWYSLEYWKQGVVFVLVITLLVTGILFQASEECIWHESGRRSFESE